MFRGAAAVNLDAKGRVAIPTRYRAEIMEKNQRYKPFDLGSFP